MKILVTGSVGNIGRKLVPYLRRCGHEVDGVDIKTGEDITHWGLEYTLVDSGYDVVYHLAALAGRKRCEENRDEALKTNVLGTYNICELCLEYGCKLIHFSTSEVYGDVPRQNEEVELYPVNWYGVTKKMGEEVVQYYGNLGLKYTIVRPFMIYDEDEDMGEYRSAIIRFAKGILKGEKVICHTETQRGWLHIDDAIRAFELLVHKPGYIINIGNEDVRYMTDVAILMSQLTNTNLFSYEDQPKGMIRYKCPDLSKQQYILNFRPQITLEEGLKRVINRMKERLAC